MSLVARTVPYPWPHHGNLDPNTIALIICAAQRQLVDSSRNAPAVVTALDTVARVIRRVGGIVVWVRHGGRSVSRRAAIGPPIRGRSGWSLVGAPVAGDVVVDSAGWDGCYESDLDHTLRSARRPTVVLGGFASEIAVDATARSLNDRGYECLVLTDASAPLDGLVSARGPAELILPGHEFAAHGLSTELIAALNHDSEAMRAHG